MNLKYLALFLTLGLIWGPTQAFADHIPESILKEIWREANVPYCLYENRKMELVLIAQKRIPIGFPVGPLSWQKTSAIKVP